MSTYVSDGSNTVIVKTDMCRHFPTDSQPPPEPALDNHSGTLSEEPVSNSSEYSAQAPNASECQSDLLVKDLVSSESQEGGVEEVCEPDVCKAGWEMGDVCDGDHDGLGSDCETESLAVDAGNEFELGVCESDLDNSDGVEYEDEYQDGGYDGDDDDDCQYEHCLDVWCEYDDGVDYVHWDVGYDGDDDDFDVDAVYYVGDSIIAHDDCFDDCFPGFGLDDAYDAGCIELWDSSLDDFDQDDCLHGFGVDDVYDIDDGGLVLGHPVHPTMDLVTFFEMVDGRDSGYLELSDERRQVTLDTEERSADWEKDHGCGGETGPVTDGTGQSDDGDGPVERALSDLDGKSGDNRVLGEPDQNTGGWSVGDVDGAPFGATGVERYHVNSDYRDKSINPGSAIVTNHIDGAADSVKESSAFHPFVSNQQIVCLENVGEDARFSDRGEMDAPSLNVSDGHSDVILCDDFDRNYRLPGLAHQVHHGIEQDAVSLSSPIPDNSDLLHGTEDAPSPTCFFREGICTAGVHLDDSVGNAAAPTFFCSEDYSSGAIHFDTCSGDTSPSTCFCAEGSSFTAAAAESSIRDCESDEDGSTSVEPKSSLGTDHSNSALSMVKEGPIFCLSISNQQIAVWEEDGQKTCFTAAGAVMESVVSARDGYNDISIHECVERSNPTPDPES